MSGRCCCHCVWTLIVLLMPSLICTLFIWTTFVHARCFHKSNLLLTLLLLDLFLLLLQLSIPKYLRELRDSVACPSQFICCGCQSCQCLSKLADAEISGVTDSLLKHLDLSNEVVLLIRKSLPERVHSLWRKNFSIVALQRLRQLFIWIFKRLWAE